MPAFDVTIVTEDRFPDLTPDDSLLRDALVASGLRVRASVWNDGTVDWSLGRITLLRSAWDYHDHPERFDAWLERIAPQTELVNALPLVRWNMHKRYLADLAARGIAVVPTLFPQPSEAESSLDSCGWDDVVIKPCVAASSAGARRFDLRTARTDALAHLRELLNEGDAMIQPFVREVQNERERSLMFFDGAFSHAVRKGPFGGFNPGAEQLDHVPPERELSFARAVLAALDEVPVYARVDVVPRNGDTVLMELEVIEPELFFRADPSAAGRLAAALDRRLS